MGGHKYRYSPLARQRVEKIQKSIYSVQKYNSKYIGELIIFNHHVF